VIEILRLGSRGGCRFTKSEEALPLQGRASSDLFRSNKVFQIAAGFDLDVFNEVRGSPAFARQGLSDLVGLFLDARSISIELLIKTTQKLIVTGSTILVCPSIYSYNLASWFSMKIEQIIGRM
jgi:hypothetical protein